MDISPYFEDNFVALYNSDARNMKELVDSSVQCVVTSPPYWGLRKYSGLPDLIWGGNEKCEHDFNIDTPPRRNRGNLDIVDPNSEQATNFASAYDVTSMKTCSLCGAWKGQYGLEPTPEMYIEHTLVFLWEIRRVLRKDGVVFWNIGDSYAGSNSGKGDYRKKKGLQKDIYDWEHPQAQTSKWDKWRRGLGGEESGVSLSGIPIGTLKPKDLCLIPFRVAIAAQEAGWWVRSVIIWSKPNPMPESVTDRPTESHEYILMLTKSAKYYWDMEAIREPIAYPEPRWGKNPKYDEQQGGLSAYNGGEHAGRNIRSVWEFPTQPFSDWGFDYEHADYVGDDGKPYILSEDCPVHWRHPEKGILKRDACDEQLNPLENGKSDNAIGLVQEPEPECISTHYPGEARQAGDSFGEQISGSTTESKISSSDKVELQKSDHIGDTQKIPVSNLDYGDRKYAPIAIDHSTQRNKKVPAPETNPSYIASVESVSHIDGKQALLFGKQKSIGENKNEVDFSSDVKGLNPLAGTLFHNVHKSYSNYKCSCRVSQVSHFAVFPEKLPEICIKAATPEVGCCPKCDASWERMTKKTNVGVTPAMKIAGCNKDGDYSGQDLADYSEGLAQSPSDTKRRILESMSQETKTLGWHQTCKCGLPQDQNIPSLVLDPFAGSGTTLWVAKKLRRRTVGYELSEGYCELALDRNRQMVFDLKEG